MNSCRASVKLASPMFRLLCLGAAALPLWGCQSNGNAKQQQQAANASLHVELMPSELVDMSPPNVNLADDTVTISGTLRRKPTNSQPISGKVDVEFLDTNGQLIDFLAVHFTPDPVPMDTSTVCPYQTSYGWTPPAGTTVRIHFVDADTAAREALSGAPEYGHTGANAPRPGTTGHTFNNAKHW